MKKNLAKKIVLGLLTGAVLMSSSVAWAGHIVEGQSVWGGYEVVNGALQEATFLGGSSSASGKNSVAVGYNSGSFGDYSIAIGANLIGNNSITQASGEGSIAIGTDSFSGGNGSIAIGTGIEITGSRSVAIGANTKVTYFDSVALGSGSVADKDNVVSVGRAASGADAGVYRKIVNVKDGSISADSHDAVTGGQLYESYGLGKEYFNNNGSTLIQGKNLTEAVVALDGAVKNITTPDLSSYAKTDDVADTYATKTELNNKANASDVYTKAQADDKFATKGYVDSTFIKISTNANDALTSGFNVVNTDDITKISVTHAGGDNPVVISSDDGITVGENSTRMDSTGFYAGGAKPHNYDNSMAAITEDGKIKGAGGKFVVDTDGSVKAADDNFKIDKDGNVTAKSVTAENLYTKEQVNELIGGGNASIAGINQRLDKTNAKINKVGAGAAALAALHPLEYDPDDKLTFSAGMGNYAGENAAALGAFYRPNEKFMVSLGGTMGNGENMVNLGLSIGLDKPNGYAKLSKRELIQKVNAMEAKYEAVEAEKEAMKAEMAEMKAMLQAILAKK